MKLIYDYIKKHKFLLFLNLLAVFSFVAVELGIPTITGQMIDKGIMLQDGDYLVNRGIVLGVLAVIGGLGSVLLSYTSARIANNMTLDMRLDIFRKTQTLSHKEYNELGISSMITRVTNDAYQLQLFVQMMLRMGMMAPIMIVSSFFLIFKSNFTLALVNLIGIPFIIGTIYIIGRKSNSLSRVQQDNLDSLNRITRENITGARVIRAFRQDDNETKRFGDVNYKYANVSKQLFRLMTRVEPLFFFILHMVVLIVFYVAANMINVGTLQVGSLLSFLEYQFHGLFALMLFSYMFVMYPRAAVSASRINEILQMEPSIKNPENGVLEGTEAVSVEFKDVTFTYPDGEANVLTNINFKANKGEMIAFIGSTGSGKSTLINLLVRFYDVSRGQVLVNGVDVRDYDLYALRDHFGFIPQKANLFSGTIASNIRYGKKDAAFEELVESAEVSAAKEFIESRPEQYESFLSEGGSNLSGGQKQRMSIARAMVRKPDIYVFDDSFSALDFKTDALIRNNLKGVTQDSIMFVVAQRISSISDADKIVVLDEGQVVGIGKHQDLIKTCEVYKEIAASQLSEEEMAAYA